MINKKKVYYCPHCGCIHLDESQCEFGVKTSEIMTDENYKNREIEKVI